MGWPDEHATQLWIHMLLYFIRKNFCLPFKQTFLPVSALKLSVLKSLGAWTLHNALLTEPPDSASDDCPESVYSTGLVQTTTHCPCMPQTRFKRPPIVHIYNDRPLSMYGTGSIETTVY